MNRFSLNAYLDKSLIWSYIVNLPEDIVWVNEKKFYDKKMIKKHILNIVQKIIEIDGLGKIFFISGDKIQTVCSTLAVLITRSYCSFSEQTKIIPNFHLIGNKIIKNNETNSIQSLENLNPSGLLINSSKKTFNNMPYLVSCNSILISALNYLESTKSSREHQTIVTSSLQHIGSWELQIFPALITGSNLFFAKNLYEFLAILKLKRGYPIVTHQTPLQGRILRRRQRGDLTINKDSILTLGSTPVDNHLISYFENLNFTTWHNYGTTETGAWLLNDKTHDTLLSLNISPGYDWKINNKNLLFIKASKKNNSILGLTSQDWVFTGDLFNLIDSSKFVFLGRKENSFIINNQTICPEAFEMDLHSKFKDIIGVYTIKNKMGVRIYYISNKNMMNDILSLSSHYFDCKVVVSRLLKFNRTTSGKIVREVHDNN